MPTVTDQQDIQLSQGSVNLKLLRHPDFPTLPLRAWDTADLYLLEMANNPARQVTIVNDQFGALTLAYQHQLQQTWTDSAMTMQAIRDNGIINNIEPENVLSKIVSMTDEPATIVGDILMRVPKSNALFAWQLQILSKKSALGARLWLTGMDKYLTKNQFNLVSQYFGTASASQGWKKARIWTAGNEQPDSKPIEILSDGYFYTDIVLARTPGVYCGSKCDPGAKAMLSYMNTMPAVRQVLDLGSGNGILGIAYALSHPDAQITFVDESAQAILCSQENSRRFGIDHRCCSVQQDIGMLDKSIKYDLIICNPPFHQGNAINEALGQYVLGNATALLNPDGELWVVGNRHLNYHASLKSSFDQCRVISNDQKFVVIRNRQPV